jgi:hypothetical protein
MHRAFSLQNRLDIGSLAERRNRWERVDRWWRYVVRNSVVNDRTASSKVRVRGQRRCLGRRSNQNALDNLVVLRSTALWLNDGLLFGFGRGYNGYIRGYCL